MDRLSLRLRAGVTRGRVAMCWLVALALAACTDVIEPPLNPSSSKPQTDISDGAFNGNPHFFFLAPMVPAPSPIGTFDATLSPMVEICIWDGTECRAALELYNTVSGPGSELVRVVPEDEHYIVNWHTDDILTNFPVAEGECYRIRVLVGLQQLGFADVAVVGSGKELKSVATGELIPLKEGRTLPIKFRIEEGALQGEIVSAGYGHSCTVDASGGAHCWGYNWYGQLGDGTVDRADPYGKLSPVSVSSEHAFKMVSAGTYHTCGVTTDGDAYCWGYNENGQLGDGSTYPYSATPVAVNGGHKFLSVAAGGYHTCGVRTDGEAYCWGYNGTGALGVGTVYYHSATPVAVNGGHAFQSVSADWYHTCGLAINGDGFCWGYNWYGSVGDGTDYATTGHWTKPNPTAVGGGFTFRSLDAGANFSCGVTIDGIGYCWGYNYHGELGDGTFTRSAPYDKPYPTEVGGGLSLQYVSAGSYHSCGLTTIGAAYCWGQNDYGQLGNGSTTGPPYYSEASPVAVEGGHTFQSVSAGWYHTCAATEVNDAYCWGNNTFGRLGDGTGISRPSPVFVIDLGSSTP